jgi:hypothetical protein
MRRPPQYLLLCLLVSAGVFVAGSAAAQRGAVHGDSVPPVRATKLTSPVTIDGALTEAAWQGRPSLDRLTQSDPIEGGAPSESTWIWAAYDDDALYVAARMWDAHPESLVVRLSRRDLVIASDRLTIYLDPFHDHRTGCYFSINAAGVLSDGLLFNDGWQDEYWDGVWQGRVRRDERGWTLETRLPFSQMRYRPGAEQLWGINFRRRIERRAEDDRLVYTPKQESGFVSRFPHLAGLENGHRGRTVEVTPYLTHKAEYLQHAPGDPFRDGSRHTPGLGGDLRAGVGNNLTLNATVNPDFGQVEVDPAVVNLSDVESYFDEKRPFFTENSQVFGNFGNEGSAGHWNFFFPNPTFFYSRRVGRAPQGGLPGDADFADMPMATHILGAAKLTGKPVPSVNFGMLHALTSREVADYQSGLLRGRAEVEPLTYYGLARGLKEMAGGLNGLGTMTTLVQRRLDDGVLRDALNEQALLAGLDGWHFFDRGKKWVVNGFGAFSRVAGTQARMTALQQGSRHYFQRPDAGYLGVDGDATSLSGYAGRLMLNKEKGNVMFNSALAMSSPGFEVNDLGYQSRTDVITGHVVAGYNWTAPNQWRREGNLWTAVYERRDFGGNPTWRGMSASGWVRLRNNWQANASTDRTVQVLDNRRTRGGPLMVQPAYASYNVHLDTNDGKKVFSCTNLSAGGSPSTGSWSRSVRPRVIWKPASSLSLELRPSLEWNTEDAQYVKRVAAPGLVPADFGGHRYVFARLDQRTASASIRLDVSLTPNLSLQTYVQPLISAGKYSGFKELARSRSYDFVRYGVDNGSTYDPATGWVDPDGPDGPAAAFAVGDPSFNFKSLRGNAVLRWEYRPGSVLYFVWTQDRADVEDLGELRFGPSARRLLDAQADNIFMVKATYHLAM